MLTAANAQAVRSQTVWGAFGISTSLSLSVKVRLPECSVSCGDWGAARRRANGSNGAELRPLDHRGDLGGRCAENRGDSQVQLVCDELVLH